MTSALLMMALWAAAPASAEGQVCTGDSCRKKIPTIGDLSTPREAASFPSDECSDGSCSARRGPSAPASPASQTGSGSPCGRRGGCPSASFEANSKAPPSPGGGGGGCSSCGDGAAAAGGGGAAAKGGGKSCGGGGGGEGGGGFFAAIANFFKRIFGG